MRKKIKLKKRFFFNRISGLDKIILLLTLIIIGIFFAVRFVGKRISQPLLNYSKIEAEKLTTIVASNSISKEVTDSLNMDELFVMTKNDDGKILTIDFNPITVNKLLSSITSSVQYNLKKIEEGDIDNLKIDKNVLLNYDKNNLTKGIFYYVPIGIALNNSLLTNIGPRIPVKFTLIGNVITNIDSKVKSYGLNNALVEVSVIMKLTEKIILPITSDSVQVEVQIPLGIKLVQGAVPNYYYNGIMRSNEAVIKVE